MAGSGSSPNPAKVLPLDSHCPSEENLSEVRREILIVEDNESDVFLIQGAIAATKLPFSVYVVNDGQSAVQFFDNADADISKPCPDLVILDINLPKKQGGEVLKHMRHSSRCGQAHVLVVSTSNSLGDREQMAQLGADAYFHKPSQFDEFMKLGDLIRTIIGRSK